MSGVMAMCHRYIEPESSGEELSSSSEEEELGPNEVPSKMTTVAQKLAGNEHFMACVALSFTPLRCGNLSPSGTGRGQSGVRVR